MTVKRKDGHATGMAAEYYVMSQLFRLGHAAALTLGNAKSIDILVKSRSGKHYDVSVKGSRGGGKWAVTSEDESKERQRIYVFLIYKDFEDIASQPLAWIIPAAVVERMKLPWQNGMHAVFYASRHRPADLDEYREDHDSWRRYFK